MLEQNMLKQSVGKKTYVRPLPHNNARLWSLELVGSLSHGSGKSTHLSRLPRLHESDLPMKLSASPSLLPWLQKTSPRFILIGLSVVLLLTGLYLARQPTSVAQEPGTEQRAAFMRLKLEPAQEILEAIALEHYEGILSNAERIRQLALDESWMVIQTEDYLRQSDEFRRSVGLIAEAARNENLDGATLGYMQMTLNCVQCHRQIRSRK